MQNFPGILVPIWNVKGKIHTAHYRPDTPRVGKNGKEIKYEWPVGMPSALDIHPHGQPYLTALDIPLWITEGEKKADSLLSHGIKVVVCLCGVESWRIDDAPNPDFGEIALRGREVRIVYDSDITVKRSVQNALKKFAIFLRNRGARVFVIYLPSANGVKVGVDDFLGAGHTLADLDGLCRAWESEGKRLQAPPSSFAPRETPPSDVLNAEYLAKYFGEDLRYCAALGGWHKWVGTHWALCREGLYGAAYEAARQTMRWLGAEAAKKEDAALLRHVSHSFSHARLTAMLDQASTMAPFPLPSTALNREHWLLNCRNGTLDLRTATLRAHDRNDYLTQCLTTDYDPLASCEQWEKFLWRLFGESQLRSPGDGSGNEDPSGDMLGFLQRAVGYSLTGSTREECLFLLWGSGRNGKSVFINTIRDMMGEYGTSAQMETFMQKANETVRNDLAALHAVRLVSAVEVQDGSRLNEGLIKQMTGNDPISTRFLYKEIFTFVPTFKIWLAFNHKPSIRGTDTAVWERIHLIPFTAYITPEERDKELTQKLVEERAGILFWAVQGCLAWQKYGLQPADAVISATKSYKTEQDTIQQFLDEQCLVGHDYVVKMSTLYAAYAEWAKTGNEYLVTKTKFTRRLREETTFTVGEKGSYNDYTITGLGLCAKEHDDIPFGA